MIHTIHDTAILAIDFNVTPELPPGANGLLRLVNGSCGASSSPASPRSSSRAASSRGRSGARARPAV